MIQNSKIKRNVIIYALVSIFGTILTLNFLQFKEIERKGIELDKLYSQEVVAVKTSKGYFYVLDYLKSKKYLIIKNITNDVENKNVIHIDIEFKGNLVTLDDFLDSLKKNESFISLDEIRLKDQKNEVYIGELSIAFYI